MAVGRRGSVRTSYLLRDASGQIIAEHVRIPLAGGGKRMFWRDARGRRGLGGIPPSTLPLYAVERLGKAAVIVLTEGESACEALLGIGVPAVATVTGAGGTPTRVVFAELTGRLVVLWPDADDQGQEHMLRIAGLLRDLRIEHRMLAVQQGVRKGWDAADAVHEGMSAHEVRSYLGSAAPTAPTAGPRADGLVLRTASTIAPRRAEWALPGRIPLGGLTLLVGQPGLGKTLLAIDIAARASCGTLGGDLEAPVDVIYASAEDSEEYTLVPRLCAAGADRDRIHFIALRRAGAEQGIALPDDIAILRQATRSTGAAQAPAASATVGGRGPPESSRSTPEP